MGLPDDRSVVNQRHTGGLFRGPMRELDNVGGLTNSASMESHGELSRDSDHLWIMALAASALVMSFIVQPSGKAGVEIPIPLLGEALRLPQVCITRTFLGIPCPGCGLIRSFVAVAHGNFPDAFRHNPMGPLLFALCLFYIFYRLAIRFGLGRTSRWRELVRDRAELVTWIIIAGLIGQWCVRLLLCRLWET
jgi:hypothetical protein